MPDTTEKTVEGCTVELLDYGTFCRTPDTVAYVSGCVHEHLDEDVLCRRHAALLLDGDLRCTVCWHQGVRTSVIALAEVLPSGERVRLERGATLAGVAPGGDRPGGGLASPLPPPGADPLPV